MLINYFLHIFIFIHVYHLLFRITWKNPNRYKFESGWPFQGKKSSVHHGNADVIYSSNHDASSVRHFYFYLGGFLYSFEGLGKCLKISDLNINISVVMKEVLSWINVVW